MSGTEADRGFEIRAHPHAERPKPHSRGKFLQQRRNAAPVLRRPAECTSNRRPAARAIAAMARRTRPPRVGATPAFCGSSPVLTSTNKLRSARRCAADFRRQRVGELAAGRASRSRRTGRARRAPCWSATARSGAARCPETRPADRGHFPCASCTRFSPNTRWPASSTGRIASAPWPLLTATSRVSPAGATAPVRAAAMRARTEARFSDGFRDSFWEDEVTAWHMRCSAKN